MSVPELNYHTKWNSWDLIFQLLNNSIRLNLASEWDPSKELADFMIQIATLTEDCLVLSWGQREKERKNKITDRNMPNVTVFFIYVWFTCCKLQQCFRECLSCHFVCKANGNPGALFQAVVLNSVSWYTSFHCDFMEVTIPQFPTCKMRQTTWQGFSKEQ